MYSNYKWNSDSTNIFITSDKNTYPEKLTDLISFEKNKEILKNVYKNVYGDYPEGGMSFPWDSGPWYKKDNGKYSLFRQNGMIHLKALIPCWGNSSRSFLAPYEGGLAPESLVKQSPQAFDYASLKSLNPPMMDLIISPNKSTVFIITDTEIDCYDTKEGDLLVKINLTELFPFGSANKIIMVESALGKYVSKWIEVF